MTPLVELRGAGRVYPAVRPVTALRPTDLVVRAGEWVAITGRSGSGKSTLLQILGLLDRPTSGSYLLDGEDVSALSDRARTRLRASRIGFVFQSFHLMPHRSALENVMVALLYHGCPRRLRAARAAEALDRVGLADRARAMPTTMSGGERQRVAVARALSIRPQLLLADEPTGNLDSATAEEVLSLFVRLNDEGQTVLMVTHDGQVAARARRRVEIVDGTVREVPTDA
ncbi:ABC transporter ATP-binding protein [Micromonospora krabiensis]|uniref:Putative ABC transport system ATP-binding protein n=1 Tax=Micromonospora krabiensis TaxID=307121 RepID=A0A1C3NBQ1_9ACTN|nr:ABC transporter ATP-binding protein [Micromonospora krabiensis]SBV29979.1 putative ABC transport system ATP-binding protein [Micromonospora krabiensis]